MVVRGEIPAPTSPVLPATARQSERHGPIVTMQSITIARGPRVPRGSGLVNDVNLRRVSRNRGIGAWASGTALRIKDSSRTRRYQFKHGRIYTLTAPFIPSHRARRTAGRAHLCIGDRVARATSVTPGVVEEHAIPMGSGENRRHPTRLTEDYRVHQTDSAVSCSAK